MTTTVLNCWYDLEDKCQGKLFSYYEVFHVSADICDALPPPPFPSSTDSILVYSDISLENHLSFNEISWGFRLLFLYSGAPEGSRAVVFGLKCPRRRGNG